MSKAPSPPGAPDPFMMGKAESQANIQSAIANSRLNDINQITPYGTVSYTFGTPTAGAASGGGAGGAAGAGGAGAAAAPPGLAWQNHVRGQLGMPPLVPGTPEYNQWLW